MEQDAQSAARTPPWSAQATTVAVSKLMAEDGKMAGRARVEELIRNFRRNEGDYLSDAYNETQARTDFITPLLEAFGWDVHNVKGQPLALREVIEEATVEVGEERLTKKPDYELRLARQRKLFVEAKKPSIPIHVAKGPAFQTRRYGYSASLPVSCLTNFHQIAVYDCIPAAAHDDEAHVARLLLVDQKDFGARFDELWNMLSRDAVSSGEFDKRFGEGVKRYGVEQFDRYFLHQVRAWRERLAHDIHANTPGLSPPELTYAVQLFLSRIVFLRICEDRNLEKYETLKALNVADAFDALMALLRRADEFYDSGLFRLLDDERLGIRISDGTLRSIIADLYYPQSPYTFAVVETEVLGQIYEQFLGEVIKVTADSVEIVTRPEVQESGGVYATPRYIVDAIVGRTLGVAIAGKSPTQLKDFTAADICCGSGVFLLSVYEFLMEHYLAWYLENGPGDHAGHRIYDAGIGQWRLTFEEKRRILLTHVRGVDIDPNAVEVARFSLLLKLIENETPEGLGDFVRRHNSPALPSLEAVIRCGNSLVSRAEWMAVKGPMSAALAAKVNPFTWTEEFRSEIARGGFDVIVGNPPYIRIQSMTVYSPEEVEYYQAAESPYVTGRQDNFDKYPLFVERALSLLREDGRLGLIVPHKFMTIQSGYTLRRLLTERHLIEEIVHFGVKQVFGPQTSNYTCILVIDRRGRDTVRLEQVGSLEKWRYGEPGTIAEIPGADLAGGPWQFATVETRVLFDRIRSARHARLDAVAEILVGVQTSADGVYIVHPVHEGADTVVCRWGDRNWTIERAILRPCLHDAQLRAYGQVVQNAWVIFPYEIVVGAKGRLRARLVQPAEFAARAPGCWAYLNARKVELEGRSISGGVAGERQWYQYGRSQSLTKFDAPKVILPVLSIEPRYAYDEANTIITAGGNGPYYMIRPRSDTLISNHYLLAVLNHPLTEAFIRTNTSTFRGGYYSHGKQFIEALPVPMPDDASRAEVEALVAQLVDMVDALLRVRTPHERTLLERGVVDLRAQVEAKISVLFGLSAEDLDVVRAVPIPS